MAKQTYKRVELENGVKVSVVHVTEGMKVLDEPATNRYGRVLDAEYPAPALELKGAELDEALKAAGLSTAGKADDKRQRLADHQTAAATIPAGDTTTTGGSAAPQGQEAPQ
ncbi:hypothetical protein QWY28_17365 [Nocardioides sp. SOB77]|uniref:Uncharacterized protein n=1 Tax=Nocardioides oceani TaxID=3058369 RepID=A0ABT8FJF5_9ACTN|nr:hypothetical protein [Nocardioides oceani]MDN4174734.1 hypothetical protein [Nocardioides oceani]